MQVRIRVRVRVWVRVRDRDRVRARVTVRARARARARLRARVRGWARLLELVDAGCEPGDRGQGGRPVRADLVVTRSLPVPARSCASSLISLFF